MIQLLLAVALVTQVGTLEATTVSDATTLSGTVLDETGQPIKGAVVGVKDFRFDGRGNERTTTTDGEGNYEIKDFEPSQLFWVVFAYKPGFGFTNKFPQNLSVTSMDFTLRKPIPASIRFFEPDGRLANDVEFELSSIQNVLGALSKSMLKTLRLPELQVVDGKLELDFLSMGGSITFKTKHPKFGTQSSYLRSAGGEYNFRFRAAAEVHGVVDLGDFNTSEVEFLLVTNPSEELDERDVRVAGAATVKPDEEGRFHVSAIETGALQVTLVNESKLPFYLNRVGNTEVTAGNPLDLKLELKKSVLVSGKVIGDDGRPVANATLNLGGLLETDADGGFHFYRRPGIIHGGFQAVPSPWLNPGFNNLAYRIPQFDDTFALPAIQLRKAAKISGVVVDLDGIPQPSVNVSASWLARSAGGTYSQCFDSTVSDELGRFELSQTDDSVRTTIKAQSKTHASVKVLTVLPGLKREVEITVSTANMSPVHGRVVDENGQPIPQAKISMMSVQSVNGQERGRSRIFFDEEFKDYQLFTDQDGKFKTPKSISTQNGVAVVVEAKGYTGVNLDTAYASTEKGFDMGDIKLERNLAISGTVVDTNGEPVEGVKVWTHGFERSGRNDLATTRSNASGQFVLQGANPESRFAFVEHPGYHFTGFAIPSSRDSSLAVRVAAKTKMPLDKPLQFADSSIMDRGENLLELLETIMESDPKSPLAQSLYRDALLQMASIYPERAVANLPRLTSSRSRAAVLFRIGDVDAAIEQLGADRNPSDAYYICKFILANPKTLHFDKLFVEANAYLDQIQDTSSRLSMAASLIVACRVAGRQRQAKQLSEKYVKLAQSDGNREHAKGTMAVAAAWSHPEIALKLLQSISDEMVSGRQMSNAAWQVANLPRVAEMFLNGIADPSDQAGLFKRMAYRMSTVDLDRALKLARTSKDRYQGENNAVALAHIAVGIAKTNPSQSKLIVREAFERMSLNEKYNYSFGPALMMLNHAMNADPDRTGEYFWRTLAKVNSPYEENPNRDKLTNRENNLAHVAILLNQYGRYPEIEKQIVDAIFDRWENNQKPNLDYRQHVPAYVAMTLHDPARAVRWYQMTWESESDQDRARPDAPWHLMARLIQAEQPETARIINRKVFNSWNIGDPYLYMFD